MAATTTAMTTVRVIFLCCAAGVGDDCDDAPRERHVRREGEGEGTRARGGGHACVTLSSLDIGAILKKIKKVI